MPIAQGPGGTPIDVVVRVKVANLHDINNINKRVNAQVKQLESQWAKVGRKINVAKIDVKAMDASVNSLGNHMGFVAFQWMFISGIASRALMTMRQIGQQILEKGAAGTTAMTRAMVQTAKLGESLDKVAIREKGIQNFIVSMSMETGKSMTETADAVKDVGKALNDVNGVIPVTQEVMRLAVIEELNMSEAAKGFIGVMNNYKNSVDSVRQVSNTLIGVNLQSRISLNELIHAFEFSAATASDMGMTLEETGTILGMMGDRLTPGRIGRQFATLLEELRETSVATNPVLQKLGVHIYDVEGNMKGLPDILKSIARAMKEAGNNSDAMKAALLDTMKLDRVAKRALIGLIDSMDEYDDALNELTSDEMNAKIQETYERLTDTPEANIAKLKAATEVLSMELVGGLAPAISEIVAEFQNMLRVAEINDLIHTLGKEIGQSVVPVVKFLAAGLASLAKELLAFKKVLGPLANVIVGVVGALVGLMVVSQLVMMFAILAAVLEKFVGTSIVAGLTVSSLTRILARVAIFAALLIVAFIGIRYAVAELRKGFDEANMAIVALGIGAAAAAIGIAAFINPIMGVAIGLAVLAPLIYEGTQELLKMAGVRPGDDWGIAFLKVLDLVLDGINEWGEQAAEAIAGWFAEMNDRGYKRFHASWGWLGTAFGEIWGQIAPSLNDMSIWGDTAINNVWKAMKDAFPIFQEFETWWNDTLNEWNTVLTKAFRELGEEIADAFVDGLLKGLGQFGWLLKTFMNIDIGKMIQDWEKKQHGATADPTRFLPPDMESGTWSSGPDFWREKFEREGEMPVEERPKEWDELPWITKADWGPGGKLVTGSGNQSIVDKAPDWWNETHPSWAEGLVYGSLEHYAKIKHPASLAMMQELGVKYTPPVVDTVDTDAKKKEEDKDMLSPDYKAPDNVNLSPDKNMNNVFDKRIESEDAIIKGNQAIIDAQNRIAAAAAGEDVLTPAELIRIEEEALAAKIAAEENLISAEQELIDLFVYGKVTMTNLNEAQYEVASEIMNRAVAEGQYNATLLRNQENIYAEDRKREEMLAAIDMSMEIRQVSDEHALVFAAAIEAAGKATVAATAHTEFLEGGLAAYTTSIIKSTTADKLNTVATSANSAFIDINSMLVKSDTEATSLHRIAQAFNTGLVDVQSKTLQHGILAANEANRKLKTFINVQDVMTHEVGRTAKDEVGMQNALIRAQNAMHALATAASITVQRLASFKMSVGYTVGTKGNGSKYISSVWPVYSMAGFGTMPAGVDTNTPQVQSERDPDLIERIVNMLKDIWGPEGPGGKSVTVNMNVERLDPDTDIAELMEQLGEQVTGADSLE